MYPEDSHILGVLKQKSKKRPDFGGGLDQVFNNKEVGLDHVFQAGQGRLGHVFYNGGGVFDHVFKNGEGMFLNKYQSKAQSLNAQDQCTSLFKVTRSDICFKYQKFHTEARKGTYTEKGQ